MAIDFEKYKEYDEEAALRHKIRLLNGGEDDPESNVDSTFSREYDEQQYNKMQRHKKTLKELIEESPGLAESLEKMDEEYYKKHPEEKEELDKLTEEAFRNFQFERVK